MKLQEQYQKKFRDGEKFGEFNMQKKIVETMLENKLNDEDICKYANCTQEFIDKVRRSEFADS